MRVRALVYVREGGKGGATWLILTDWHCNQPLGGENGDLAAALAVFWSEISPGRGRLATRWLQSPWLRAVLRSNGP
jgi:hypothetical protein